MDLRPTGRRERLIHARRARVRQAVPRAAFLGATDYAHRGLHGPGTGFVENSLPAFSAAAERGFGIECDVRLSADGIVFVFHDDRLDRMTDARGRLADRTADALDRIVLGSDGPIPRLSALLGLVAGRVPLLIELKVDRGERAAPLCRAVRDTLDGYVGPMAVMSFHPSVARWFRTHAPQVPRGLVVTEDGGSKRWGAARRSLAIRLIAPDFLAHDIRDLPSPFSRLARRRGLPVLSWTVRTGQHWQAVRAHADAAIFEGERPERHG